METPKSKIAGWLFVCTATVWLAGTTVQNIAAGKLLVFGTVELVQNLPEQTERSVYETIAQTAVVRMLSYPLVILSAFLFVRWTKKSFAGNGWLLMSTILLFIFIPVEGFCLWREWKIIGLLYWGSWPVEEFRKAFIVRVTALGGLPMIASLCYYTIVGLIVVQPMKKKEIHAL